jgi:hypothetical protein
MKTKSIAALLCAGCVVSLVIRHAMKPDSLVQIAEQPENSFPAEIQPALPPPEQASEVQTNKQQAFVPAGSPAMTLNDSHRLTIATPAEQDTPEHPIDPEVARLLAGWKNHFAALEAAMGTREAAASRLVADVDQSYQSVVRRTVEEWRDLSDSERADRLAELEEDIQEGTTMLKDELGLDGDVDMDSLPAAAEALSAETQYGSTEVSHEQRLALLRLDQEREKRMSELFASDGFGPGTDHRIETELEPWYESQLKLIFGDEDQD